MAECWKCFIACWRATQMIFIFFKLKQQTTHNTKLVFRSVKELIMKKAPSTLLLVMLLLERLHCLYGRYVVTYRASSCRRYCRRPPVSGWGHNIAESRRLWIRRRDRRDRPRSRTNRTHLGRLHAAQTSHQHVAHNWHFNAVFITNRHELSAWDWLYTGLLLWRALYIITLFGNDGNNAMSVGGVIPKVVNGSEWKERRSDHLPVFNHELVVNKS